VGHDPGRDNDGRQRTDDRYYDLRDRIFPRLHGKWWNWDAQRRITRDAELLEQDFARAQLEDAKAALEHVEAIGGTARDRAEAADRRATTIAGTVAIAASFTLGGAGVVLDSAKFEDNNGLRIAFAAVLAATTIAFVVSAAYALTALVNTRHWRWSAPDHLDGAIGKSAAVRYGIRSAHLLDDFAFNWEVSVLKNHLVDKALWSLIVALVGIAVLAVFVFASTVA
jgi:hypothetical protein